MVLNKLISDLKNTEFVKRNVNKIYIDNDHTDTWIPIYVELKERTSDKETIQLFFENINEILNVPSDIFVSIYSIDDIDEDEMPFSYRASTKVYDRSEED